jgi:hypothetical protein
VREVSPRSNLAENFGSGFSRGCRYRTPDWFLDGDERVTAPINPHVHTDSRRIAADAQPAQGQRNGSDGIGAIDPDDASDGGLSAAVSVDVRGAVGAENAAAAASMPEHLEAAAQLVSALTAQIGADPEGARAAHTGLDAQSALSLLV